MTLNVWIALLAGFASFISPCVLPLYPSYISYITGISVSQLSSDHAAREVRYRTMMHTLFFIIGFSIVFYALGFGAGIIGEVFNDYRTLISQLAAILIIVMGLFLMGIFQPQWLMKERKMKVNAKPAGYIGSMLIGIGFSAGWSPCVGPILAAIIGLAVSEPGAWLSMITAYIIGFALPFFILAFFIGRARWLVKYSAVIMKVGGAFMIVMGILLFTGQMIRITIWFNQITPEWMKF